METSQHSSKLKFLRAALKVIRSKGYAATTVDDLCAAAGLTKGGFFHHFRSKEDLAVSAAQYWSEWTGGIFAAAPYQNYSDPLDQLIGYVDFRSAMLKGRPLPEFTCLLGTLVQETYESNPAIREACKESLDDHITGLTGMIAAAKARHAPAATWTAESLAQYTQATIQGAFILAKAQNSADVAADCLLHLRRYIELLFHYGKED